MRKMESPDDERSQLSSAAPQHDPSRHGARDGEPDGAPPLSIQERIARYDRRQEFEHQLIDRKTTWVLTSQSLLFAAYALSASAAPGEQDVVRPTVDLQGVIVGAGLALSVVALVGVAVHIVSKFIAWRRHKASDETDVNWGVWTPNTVVGAISDLLVPLVFSSAWLALGGWSGLAGLIPWD